MDNFTIAAKLDEARALIEKGWCQGAFAKDEHGSTCHETTEDAVCWCAAGAAFAVARNIPEGANLVYALERAVGGDVTDFNDDPDRNQYQVIQAFKRAADLARSA